jgi:hypothetical protein
MKNLVVASKVLNLLVCLCFFMPFLPKGCSVSQKELKEKIVADSVRIVDSISALKEVIPDSIKKKILLTQLHRNLKYPQTITERISGKYGFLKPILRPNDGYSGIGLMLDYYSTSGLFMSLCLSFILSLVCFILILKNKQGLYSLLLILTLLGLIAFVTFRFGLILTDHLLFGYKIEIVLWSILVIINLMIKIRGRSLQMT